MGNEGTPQYIKKSISKLTEEYVAGSRDWESLYGDVVEIVEKTHESALSATRESSELAVKQVGGIVNRLREMLAERDRIIAEKDAEIARLRKQLGQ